MAEVYTERLTCRACGSKTLVEVLNLGMHYLPRFVREADMSLPKSPLNLVRCAACGLLQLLHTVNPDLVYREFWYRSSMNQTMKDALGDLVTDAELSYSGPSGGWLDIGANDGYLLSRVPTSFTRIACEPALNFEDELHEHADIVIPDYFSADRIRESYDRPIDVITSAAMFYDLDDPDTFVAGIAGILSDGGIWVNQLNDSTTMVAKNAWDSICHEHVCYWDLRALDACYSKHGLSIFKVSHNDVNGGSVRVFARKDRNHKPTIYPAPTQQDCMMFANRAVRWKIQFRELLTREQFHHKPLWGYGASTKGSTLLQYLDCSEAFIGIADRNPLKVGLRMAGTWIPITDEVTMRRANPGYVIVLPWAFKEEFVKREAELLRNGATLVFPLPNLEFVL